MLWRKTAPFEPWTGVSNIQTQPVMMVTHYRDAYVNDMSLMKKNISATSIVIQLIIYVQHLLNYLIHICECMCVSWFVQCKSL